MVALGLSDDVIIAKIRGASCRRNPAVRHQRQRSERTQGRQGLRRSHQGDDQSRPCRRPVVVAATPISNDPNLPPPEVGVYWKNGNAFTRIEGQAISQAKVGGKAGSMFTYGLRNEHWDAYLNGPQSKNVINDHLPVFYIYVPDGASASDFVLISLEKKGDRQRVPDRKLRRHHRRQIRRQARQGDRLHRGARRNQDLQDQARRSHEARRIRLLHGHRPAVNHGRRFHRRRQIRRRRRGKSLRLQNSRVTRGTKVNSGSTVT